MVLAFLRLVWRHAKAFVAAARYGFPARKLVIIGVTGTDGKTTTVGMIAHILHGSGKAVAALSTALIRIKDRMDPNPTEKTTPSPFVIQGFLRKSLDAGCTHVVLEYSSHGLVQKRTAYTWPTVAAITNTALEHLDYHGTMEQYRRDKGILFWMLRGRGTKVLNRDDATYAEYAEIPSIKTISWSAKSGTADLWISDCRKGAIGAACTLQNRGGGTWNLELSIPGAFNLENALCALSCAHALGVPIEESVRHLKNFKAAPGRLERIDEGQAFAVYVDFTVTPQAFEKTLTTVRDLIAPDKRVLVLTGSCGNRMREKRPIIGKICSKLADVVVITDDEPYTEDPEKIIEEIWAGVDASQCEAHKILDRRRAIAEILSLARPGDAVLLCGMGSYPVRITAAGPVPWNEQEITRACLRQL